MVLVSPLEVYKISQKAVECLGIVVRHQGEGKFPFPHEGFYNKGFEVILHCYFGNIESTLDAPFGCIKNFPPPASIALTEGGYLLPFLFPSRQPGLTLPLGVLLRGRADLTGGLQSPCVRRDNRTRARTFQVPCWASEELRQGRTSMLSIDPYEYESKEQLIEKTPWEHVLR